MKTIEECVKEIDRLKASEKRFIDALKDVVISLEEFAYCGDKDIPGAVQTLAWYELESAGVDMTELQVTCDRIAAGEDINDDPEEE